MAYADGLLSSGERVVHREKQHWWVFVWGARYTILAVVIAIVFFFLGGMLSPDGVSGTARTVLGWVTAALFIGGLALLLWTTLRYLNQDYVVTNRRVIQVEGVVNKRAVDSSLEKINDAVLTQSVFGRALDFGDLQILTASEAAISDFQMLRRPVRFKKAMLEAKHEYEREVGGSGPSEPLSPPLRATAAPGGGPAGGSTGAPGSTTTPGSSPSPSPAASPVAAAGAVPGEAGGRPDGGVAAEPAPAQPGSDELTRILASLADLRDRGAITQAEYDRKKAEILARL